MHFSPEAVFTQQTSYLDSTVDDSSRPSAPSVSISCTPVFSPHLAFIILHCHWPTCLLGSSRNDITLTRPLVHQSLPLGPPVRLTGFQRTLMGGYVQHKSNHTAQMGQKWKKREQLKLVNDWPEHDEWAVPFIAPLLPVFLYEQIVSRKNIQSEENERSRTVSDCQKVRTGRTSVESNGGSPVTTAYKSKQGGFLAVTNADLFRQQQLANKRDFWEGITMKPVRGSTTRSVCLTSCWW